MGRSLVAASIRFHPVAVNQFLVETSPRVVVLLSLVGAWWFDILRHTKTLVVNASGTPELRPAGMPLTKAAMSTNASPITLAQLVRGQHATIVQLGCERALRRRLLDMGLVTGETITLSAVAPLGDPIEITVKGYRLSLRKAEASLVFVELGP
jgi:ferrous iron transport protein A